MASPAPRSARGTSNKFSICDNGVGLDGEEAAGVLGEKPFFDDVTNVGPGGLFADVVCIE